MSAARPFREDDAPGRIPESLIDSVLDGAVDERTKREVARALRHDPRRRQDVAETIEALSALRSPVDCPDLSGDVLRTLDRKHKFLSARSRRLIRRARTSGLVGALLLLVCVAGVQRAMPRFSSITAQPTPVNDIAQAVQADTVQAAGQVRDRVRVMQASLPSLAGSMEVPGRAYRSEAPADLAAAVAGMEQRFRLVTIDGGRFFLIETVQPGRAGTAGRGGFVASFQITTDLSGDPDDTADPLP